MKEEILVKIANRTEKESRAKLLKTANDQHILHAVDLIRKQQLINNGFSKDRKLRWIGSIPADIYQATCKIYGEKNLKKDKRLFKRVFEPWLLVKPGTI